MSENQINLAMLNNDDLLDYIQSRLIQYKQEQELNQCTSEFIYNAVKLHEIQEFEKHLQRVVVSGNTGAVKLQVKVASILKENNIVNEYGYKDKAPINMYEYWQKQNQY